MSTMKQVCDQVKITYETLRFYCDEGLVPNVMRDKNNYRVFDERNIAWINGLQCLKKCGMSIKDMKQYMYLCIDGQQTISKRKNMLDNQKQLLLKKLEEINECLEFIDNKQKFYDGVLAGTTPYTSNLIDVKESL